MQPVKMYNTLITLKFFLNPFLLFDVYWDITYLIENKKNKITSYTQIYLYCLLLMTSDLWLVTHIYTCLNLN